MICDTQTLAGQTLSERKEEVKQSVSQLDRAIREGRVKVRVGNTGGIAFDGWGEFARRRVTDGCAYRRLMATGSATTKAAIAKAEALAGRSIDRRAVAQGLHAHGNQWHGGH